MNRIRPDVDVILDILQAAVSQHPASTFLQSLLQQYLERGSLSKKQLQGLHSKAGKFESIPVHKLATLEAIINKKPNRYKSPLPSATPLYTKDTRVGGLLTSILNKYPEHKRILFLQSKYNNDEPLSTAEITEIEKLVKLLCK